MFAERLKALRKEMGITQIQLATELNVASGTIAMWETGKREPNYEITMKLADFFHTTTDYLLGRDNQKEEPTSKDEDGQKKNFIKILGRDGSCYEGMVSDSQLQLFKQMLDNLKPVEDENL